MQEIDLHMINFEIEPGYLQGSDVTGVFTVSFTDSIPQI
jgi:hypothetical protein